MNKFKGILVLIGTGLLVFFITRAVYEPEQRSEQVSSTVLLERVRPVLKLVTVEGEFSEVFSYRNAEAAFEWLKDYTPFQKKAMLRVKARVSVGYDIEGMDLNVDEGTKTITLRGMTAPEVLSIEHDIDYYDMDAGTFNPFTAQDLTKMGSTAKSMVRAKIPESGLFRAAAERKQEMITVVRALVESSGWKFVDASGEAAPVKG
ncbi:MAG: DUF4230 domain-containing protein [Flavobacteriales bacterium]|nr:DUF4230 domain-containing protein [Flavobacteriales bacterium]HRH70307.1 DUF4230 domain-containing protein [Flavobacteriales bacterium]